METWEYVPWLTGAAGAVVTVHDPGTYPAPADQGVTLLPGWQTDVAVTLVTMRLLFATMKSKQQDISYARL